jgi:hypothetical protein
MSKGDLDDKHAPRSSDEEDDDSDFLDMDEDGSSDSSASGGMEEPDDEDEMQERPLGYGVGSGLRMDGMQEDECSGEDQEEGDHASPADQALSLNKKLAKKIRTILSQLEGAIQTNYTRRKEVEGYLGQ